MSDKPFNPFYERILAQDTLRRMNTGPTTKRGFVDNKRQTGRTTRMLGEAIAYAEEHPRETVLVIMHDKQYCQRICSAVAPRKLKNLRVTTELNAPRTNPETTKVFRDHEAILRAHRAVFEAWCAYDELLKDEDEHDDEDEDDRARQLEIEATNNTLRGSL